MLVATRRSFAPWAGRFAPVLRSRPAAHTGPFGRSADRTGWSADRIVARVLRIGSIVLRVDDLPRQTEFWQAALDYIRRDDGTSDDFVLLAPKDGAGPSLSLDEVRSEL